MVSISSKLLPRLNDDIGDEMSECIMVQSTTELREHSETTNYNALELREQTQTTNLKIRRAMRPEQLQMVMMHT